MNIFYNEKGIGDTLLIRIKETDKQEWKAVQHGDVVSILDDKNGEVLGYNIFNVSKYGKIDANGPVEKTEEIQKIINDAFSKNGLDSKIKLEDRPSFVVGYVESKEKHPNADKLSICEVNIGTETLQIVCGAPNVDKGQRVVVALIGAVMPSGLVIKKSALRGVESSGMICSAKELAIPDAPEEKGILVLDPSYEIGSPFKV